MQMPHPVCWLVSAPTGHWTILAMSQHPQVGAVAVGTAAGHCGVVVVADGHCAAAAVVAAVVSR